MPVVRNVSVHDMPVLSIVPVPGLPVVRIFQVPACLLLVPYRVTRKYCPLSSMPVVNIFPMPGMFVVCIHFLSSVIPTVATILKTCECLLSNIKYFAQNR
jgi:hypothetical protein